MSAQSRSPCNEFPRQHTRCVSVHSAIVRSDSAATISTESPVVQPEHLAAGDFTQRIRFPVSGAFTVASRRASNFKRNVPLCQEMVPSWPAAKSRVGSATPL
ncbi:hypothetical protein MRX96_009243 [Rhipicephalus microplus]